MARKINKASKSSADTMKNRAGRPKRCQFLDHVEFWANIEAVRVRTGLSIRQISEQYSVMPDGRVLNCLYATGRLSPETVRAHYYEAYQPVLQERREHARLQAAWNNLGATFTITKTVGFISTVEGIWKHRLREQLGLKYPVT